MRKTSTYVSSSALHIIMFTSISLTLSQSPFKGNDGSNDLVDQICKQTPYYDLCSLVLHSNPLDPNIDVKGVTLTMVKINLANATNTLGYIEGLIKQTPDPQLERALDFCAETYIPIVKYILPQAVDSICKGRFGLANYSMSYASKEVSTCDQKFSGSPKSPLKDKNVIFQKLLDVASAIITQLIKG